MLIDCIVACVKASSSIRVSADPDSNENDEIVDRVKHNLPNTEIVRGMTIVFVAQPAKHKSGSSVNVDSVSKTKPRRRN
jgi:hypothetical protein